MSELLKRYLGSYSQRHWATFAIFACLYWLATPPLNAQDYSAVQAIFEKHCYQCHGATKREGGLRLDRGKFILTGGDNGPIVVRQDSDKSELVKRITSIEEDRMPPEGAGLSPEEVQQIKTWIDADLPNLPMNEDAANDDSRLSHWAWQPISKPALPTPKGDNSLDTNYIAFNSIDSFIIQKLQEKGLPQSPLASWTNRLRRLSYDLHGLPPSPINQPALAAHESPEEHYGRVVEQWLADPAYGEKWARHWLDIAHYADTHGFERDQRRQNAWRYRDYVINGWNHDLPYDQFVRQQIAGDALAPRDSNSVIATGFLAAGPYDFVGQEETQNEVLRRQARADDLDDMLTQIMTSLCGVTIHCARCHEHKLDPISQAEYYEMISLFAAVRRSDRPVDYLQLKEYDESQKQLTQKIAELNSQLRKLRNNGLDLADVVGGGNGFGTGKFDAGIDPATGNIQLEKRGFLDNLRLNHFSPINTVGLDGIAIPDGLVDGTNHRLQVTSTGIEIEIPDTSGACWDAIRNGPVNAQHSLQLAGIDYSAGHNMLGTHANVAFSIDLDELRTASQKEFARFQSGVGYFGQTEREGATVAIFLDGFEVAKFEKLGRLDGLYPIDVALQKKHRFLTFLVTDNGNGIGHDQVCFIDPLLVIDEPSPNNTEAQRIVQAEIGRIELELKAAQLAKDQLQSPIRYFGITSGTETPIFRLRRGNPEDPLESVQPNAIRCVPVAMNLPAITTDDERRLAFAQWLTDSKNPLTARVIVNRLWHYHFGRGLVDTPSDFGLGGTPPSHPELLDWLAAELIEHDWSIKHIQRLICSSYTYQQSSLKQDSAYAIDAQNQWLWRRSPKRLDAEALRDTVLSLSGCLDREFYGPGYEDFDYQEEYAPVYRYKPANEPSLWRRSIYRYIVRTTTHQFLATLDCPNAANLTPVRDHTTTPLQALALLNNDFMRDQARRFADRLQQECGDDSQRTVVRAFELAYARQPSKSEIAAAMKLSKQTDLETLCLMLFNSNEFIFVD